MFFVSIQTDVVNAFGNQRNMLTKGSTTPVSTALHSNRELLPVLHKNVQKRDGKLLYVFECCYKLRNDQK